MTPEGFLVSRPLENLENKNASQFSRKDRSEVVAIETKSENRQKIQ
jgi:hypothetical protein